MAGDHDCACYEHAVELKQFSAGWTRTTHWAVRAWISESEATCSAQDIEKCDPEELQEVCLQHVAKSTRAF